MTPPTTTRRAFPPPRARRRAGARANAMTELIVCLLPMMLALLGIVLMGHLSLGRQEASKAVAWYLNDPDAANEADVMANFFPGDRGEPRIPDKNVDAPPKPAETSEEPVFPYGDRLDGNIIDLAAALERSLNRVINATGQLSTVDRRGVVRKLARLGVITNYEAVVGSTVALDMDNPSGTDVPTLEYDEEILLQAADVLGGTRGGSSGSRDADAWLHYGRAQVDSYEGGLAKLGLGQEELPMETRGEDARRFRGDFTLKGEDGQPLAMLEGLVRNKASGGENSLHTDGGLGTHDRGPAVPLGRIPDKIKTDENESVDPLNNTLMSGVTGADAAYSVYWNKSHGLL